MRKQNFGKVPLECMMLTQPIKKYPDPPLGLFPTYCFDVGADALRASFNFGTELILHNAIGRFAGKNVAIDTVVQTVDVIVATGHIDILKTDAMPQLETEPVNSTTEISREMVQVGAGVMVGQAISRVPPIYPRRAKRRM